MLQIPFIVIRISIYYNYIIVRVAGILPKVTVINVVESQLIVYLHLWNSDHLIVLIVHHC